PETGAAFGGRFDGGPTSWHADILTANAASSYREFMVEFADFHLAYEAGGGIDAQGRPRPDPAKAIIPAGVEAVGLPFPFSRPGGRPRRVAAAWPRRRDASD